MNELRITPEEYPPYYHKYIRLVPKGNILKLMQSQLKKTEEFLNAIPEEKSFLRYEQEKWSIKEVVGHMADVERIFGYRALRFSRQDDTELPGFDQDEYVRYGNFNHQPFQDLIRQFKLMREANILMFKNLDGVMWLRKGVANQGLVSVRAFPYMIVGHEIHHIHIIKDRYLNID